MSLFKTILFLCLAVPSARSVAADLSTGGATQMGMTIDGSVCLRLSSAIFLPGSDLQFELVHLLVNDGIKYRSVICLSVLGSKMFSLGKGRLGWIDLRGQYQIISPNTLLSDGATSWIGEGTEFPIKLKSPRLDVEIDYDHCRISQIRTKSKVYFAKREADSVFFIDVDSGEIVIQYTRDNLLNTATLKGPEGKLHIGFDDQGRVAKCEFLTSDQSRVLNVEYRDDLVSALQMGSRLLTYTWALASKSESFALSEANRPFVASVNGLKLKWHSAVSSLYATYWGEDGRTQVRWAVSGVRNRLQMVDLVGALPKIVCVAAGSTVID